MKRRAGIAQLVEQRTENPRARGSSPRPGILICIRTLNVAISKLMSLYIHFAFLRADSQGNVAKW